MTYLSISNFWKYQNADVWKKSKTHPPWCKLWVHRDRELDALPPLARLLWFELLAAATRYSNVLEADLNWIYAETRVEPEQIAEMLPMLIKGGWLSETLTPRRSRQPSRTNLDDPRDQDLDVDKDGEQEQEVGSQAFVQEAEPLPSPLETLPITKTLEERNPHDPVVALLLVCRDADEDSERVLRSMRLPEYAYRQATEQISQQGGGIKLAVAILKRIEQEHNHPPDTPTPVRTNVQPKDAEAAIRRQIANGLTDPIALEAELRAAGLNGDTATELRALITTPPEFQPDTEDDIPF